MADRREIAEQLVDLHIEHGEIFGKIDDLKEQLRQFAEASVDETADTIAAEVRKLLKEGLAVDDLKAELRKLTEPGHHGFTEKFAGKGDVTVSGGSKEKFKGIMPVLDEAAFLALPQGRQDALIEAKVIKMDKQFTKGSKPSVTVKL
jgi:hypothetical protein